MPEVFELELTLMTIKPKTWRRVVVPADYTFYRLHRVILICFGWTGIYYHQFHCPRPDEATEFVTIAPLFGVDHEGDAVDDTDVFLSQVFVDNTRKGKMHIIDGHSGEREKCYYLLQFF